LSEEQTVSTKIYTLKESSIPIEQILNDISNLLNENLIDQSIELRKIHPLEENSISFELKSPESPSFIFTIRIVEYPSIVNFFYDATLQKEVKNEKKPSIIKVEKMNSISKIMTKRLNEMSIKSISWKVVRFIKSFIEEQYLKNEKKVEKPFNLNDLFKLRKRESEEKEKIIKQYESEIGRDPLDKELVGNLERLSIIQEYLDKKGKEPLVYKIDLGKNLVSTPSDNLYFKFKLNENFHIPFEYHGSAGIEAECQITNIKIIKMVKEIRKLLIPNPPPGGDKGKGVWIFTGINPGKSDIIFYKLLKGWIEEEKIISVEIKK